MTRYEPEALFLADDYAMRAGGLLVRAVTAGEAGRVAEQRQMVSEAADLFAKALALLNLATEYARSA